MLQISSDSRLESLYPQNSEKLQVIVNCLFWPENGWSIVFVVGNRISSQNEIFKFRANEEKTDRAVIHKFVTETFQSFF